MLDGGTWKRSLCEIVAMTLADADDGASMQSAAYGVCIASKYQNVQKGMCAKEFKAVMDCYVVSPCNDTCILKC